MELLLVRHALPVRREVTDGPADPELSIDGRAQAEHLATYLSSEHLDAIYASPLRRVNETAVAQRIVVVCHGGVINGYLCHVLGLVRPRGFFYPNYTAARGGTRSVVTINETAHLRGTGLPMELFQAS